MTLANLGNVPSLCSRASWLMRSKHFFDIRIKDIAGCFGDAVVDIPDGIVC